MAELSNASIRSALAEAVLPPLLPALAHLTGDLSLLSENLRPDAKLIMADAQGGMSDAQQAGAREVAFQAIADWRDAGMADGGELTDAELLELMEFAVGATGLDGYLRLLKEELGVTIEDQRAPGWHKDDLDADRSFKVAIIGAGMSGLLAGFRLRQAGLDFVIFEKNTGAGGTWWENAYPGCRVDVPSHLYSYSFAQRHDWPQHYSTQPVLREYFQSQIDSFGLAENIRYETEVVSARFDDGTSSWCVEARGPDGGKELHDFDAVISAVGQLNRPKDPDIPGLSTFAGPAFHSALWDSSVDLNGKRAAVIGTGASAVQFVPVVAKQASSVTVFQRTPPWLAPTSDYHDAVSDGLRWLYENLPRYSQWHRFWMFWRTGDGALPNVTVDPTWPDQQRSVSQPNDLLRQLLTAYLEDQFRDRRDLLAKVVPDYPPGAKRILRDNGEWARALMRDDVALVTERICKIGPHHVVTADGVEHEVDVLIYGTGFHASQFLEPMCITGRGGRELHGQWKGDARAYLGITVPNFPNLFLLYGPNTNIVVNGTIIYFSECEVRYVMGCLRLLLEQRHRAMDVRAEVHDEYNVQVDAGNARMAWGSGSVSSWYKNAAGRVTQNWPFTLLEFWARTLAPDPADYLAVD